MLTEAKIMTGHGKLPLDLGLAGAFHKFEVIGGPYDDFVPGDDANFGVCVRAERVRPHAVHVPIHDFDVPRDAQQVENALIDTLIAAINGKRVYVGCMGGWGRTGLFLALLAKAAGVKYPILYVRENYTERAVETSRQEVYVDTFDVSRVRSAVNRYAWRKRLPILRLFGF